mmetsp:Transcript_7560/g.23774  ORF Transcript_7560/g.23774 Transcript_7560/m.23774 type:complete len:231 (-) Transcript_7560:17-709(-)
MYFLCTSSNKSARMTAWRSVSMYSKTKYTSRPCLDRITCRSWTTLTWPRSFNRYETSRYVRCASDPDAKALKHFFNATTRRLPRRSMPFQTMPYAPRPRRPQTSTRRSTRRSTCSGGRCGNGRSESPDALLCCDALLDRLRPSHSAMRRRRFRGFASPRARGVGRRGARGCGSGSDDARPPVEPCGSAEVVSDIDLEKHGVSGVSAATGHPRIHQSTAASKHATVTVKAV